MPVPYFVADSAQVTVLRSLASTAFGKYNLTLPEGVDLEDVYEVAAPGNELAYVSSLGPRKRVGGMFRRFVRADVDITAKGEGVSPASNVERVLDEAAQRTSGDFFLDSDISLAGLGSWRPFEDFVVGDVANVEILGRVVQLRVTRIEPKRTDHSDTDWSVHVGGQLVSDADARLAENAEIYNAVVDDRRDLAGLDGKIRAETSNRKAAVAQERTERQEDVAQVREVLGGAQADEKVLVSQLAAVQAQIAGMVGDGEVPPPPGMLNSYLWMNTRLWQQQDEINRLNDDFRDEVRERQRKQQEQSEEIARRTPVIVAFSGDPTDVAGLGEARVVRGDFQFTKWGDWTGTLAAILDVGALNSYSWSSSWRVRAEPGVTYSGNVGAFETVRSGLLFVIRD